MKCFFSSLARQQGIDFGMPHTAEISFRNERARQAIWLESVFSEALSLVKANIIQDFWWPKNEMSDNKQMAGL